MRTPSSSKEGDATACSDFPFGRPTSAWLSLHLPPPPSPLRLRKLALLAGPDLLHEGESWLFLLVLIFCMRGRGLTCLLCTSKVAYDSPRAILRICYYPIPKNFAYQVHLFSSPLGLVHLQRLHPITLAFALHRLYSGTKKNLEKKKMAIAGVELSVS
ncbi:hypothetical protein VNO78_10021 [Psophocarpus tetragonolobus]|uniref:Uncharacterized protein n=1 Tax=Psophocarpus tetragonolobus TaxID=3891 RepID=A0AAN9SQM7_PSOTE